MEESSLSTRRTSVRFRVCGSRSMTSSERYLPTADAQRSTPPADFRQDGSVTPLALFDLDNTLVDRQATYRRWAVSFAGTRDLDEEAIDWLCEVDNDGF